MLQQLADLLIGVNHKFVFVDGGCLSHSLVGLVGLALCQKRKGLQAPAGLQIVALDVIFEGHGGGRADAVVGAQILVLDGVVGAGVHFVDEPALHDPSDCHGP